MSETEITIQENLISDFRARIKAISLKPRTINAQFRNRSNTNSVQQRLIARRDKAKLNSQIALSNARIISLREAIIGV